ncbi:hypothetical protein M3661_27900 [Paenibacillus sp. MER 180]|uniref:hypothetical protein n=1 Tax=Paenibacillus sp. MER 180 TaxID=2939570 RepID=UPI00203D4FD0|nr:hypothetical protein [Paenibacillus sp. MER 180]MCM3293923.1 hypothetical protein [Paenibacillus sp. MER 180]
MNKGITIIFIGAIVTMSVLTSQVYADVPGAVSGLMTPPAPQADEVNPYEVAGIYDPQEVNDFIVNLQSAVAANDKKAVAEMVSYPLRVNQAGHSTQIASKTAFVKQYNSIITKKVRQKVLAQEVNKLFVNYNGVMIGDGEMWISKIDGKIAIYAMNL